MAAFVCHGMLPHFYSTRSSLSSPQLDRTLKPSTGLGCSSRLGLHHGLPRLGSVLHGRCFQRITSSRVGQIHAKRLLQVVATTSAAVKEDVPGFGLVKGVAKSVSEAVRSFQKPAMAALLCCLLVSQTPEMAVAASGGRVGGSTFRSGGGGQTRSAPARPLPAPRQSYSRPSAPIYSAPSIHTYHSDYITTFPLTAAAPSHYMGPATSFGLGSSSLFFIAFCMGCASMISINGFLSEKTFGGSLRAGTQTSSVLKLQVGLLGLARTLQQDLDQIAEDADTTTTKGLHNILTEACLSLLRHPDFCMSGLSSSFVKQNASETEEQFNQLSLEERGKFDEETFINVNSIRKRMMGASNNNRFSNEFIVVTILVAVEGEHKLSAISSSGDLQLALQKLGSLSESSVQAVEVLWTPQDENDTLSERELLRKYPLLRSL